MKGFIVERDEYIFAYVMDELDSGIKNEALWVKAFAIAEGDESKHKAFYLQYRAEEIKSVFEVNNIDYRECSQSKISEYIENDFKEKLAPEWMKKLWKWADDNNIPDLDWDEISADPDEWSNWEGIPRDSKKLINLKTLYLMWYTEITEMPKEIGSLINLELLSISRFANLKELPKEIGNLVNLKELKISWNNSLAKIPKEIGNLSSLEKFDLSYNKNLKTLPEEIGKLSQLKYLDFCCHTGDGIEDCTVFDTFPEELSNLKSLRMMRVDRQNKNDIPDGLFDVSDLSIYCNTMWPHDPEVLKEKE